MRDLRKPLGMPLTPHLRAKIFHHLVGSDQIDFGCGFVLGRGAQGQETIYATWMGGNDYQNKSPIYGAYPKNYLERLVLLFPDAERVLHLFSGSLTEEQANEVWEDQMFNFADQQLANFIPRERFHRMQVEIDGPNVDCLLLPRSIRFDNGLHPAAKAAEPDVVGDAQQLQTAILEVGTGSDYITRAQTVAGNFGIGVWPFDVVFADPPYRLPDQRRYWRESMMALEGVCGWCGRPARTHVPIYRASDRTGALKCRSHLKNGKMVHGELTLAGYIRFKPLNKKKVIQEAHAVLNKGGYLVWLDEIRPPYDNKRWLFRGCISIWRSTGHRIRGATLLEAR